MKIADKTNRTVVALPLIKAKKTNRDKHHHDPRRDIDHLMIGLPTIQHLWESSVSSK